MDRWSKITEFLACGVLVLPLVIGFGMRSFEAFALTLAPMLLMLITVTLGAPTVPAPVDDDEHRKDD
ncbi:hypothetical protein GPA19_11660 [Azoarcus indigens]|uniref:Uncharacterized protein n=1 Tax=Azoarcus indigens TaxID=29545 RepID=A0A4R6DXF4_9RHOO|nr:hypothetical protein [Azoarcus indigens]NMG65604.1 hypothetical protein [Azoarcus indigens]TDN49990.1 hypothetical protein C7389_11083 [Azoarcus indigens]